jgi:hypothetical protein
VDSVCASPGENVVWAAGPGEGGVSFLKSVDGGASWVDTPIAVPRGRAAGAFVSCAGIDAWVLVDFGGAAAGNEDYALFRTGEGGPVADPVLQQGYTRPLGDVPGVVDAPGGYAGPLAVLDGVHARFVTWSPAGGPVTVLVTNNASGPLWIPGEVTHENWVTPSGISFVSPDRGWILLSVGGPKPARPEILQTADGGMTWTPTCEAGRSGCFGIVPSG